MHSYTRAGLSALLSFLLNSVAVAPEQQQQQQQQQEQDELRYGSVPDLEIHQSYALQGNILRSDHK